MRKVALSIALMCCFLCGAACRKSSSVSGGIGGNFGGEDGVGPLLFNLKPGAKYQTETEEHNTMESVGGPRKRTLVMNSFIACDTRVLKAQNNYFTLRTYFRKVDTGSSRETLAGGDPAASLNSGTNTMDSTDTIERAINALTGRMFEYDISREGEILRIEKLEENARDIVMRTQGAGETTDPSLAPLIRETIKVYLAGVDRPSLADRIVIKKSAAVGTTWTHKEETKSSVLPLESEATYTLNSRENGVISVTIDMEQHSVETAKPSESSQIIKASLSQTRKCSLEIDEETGWIVSASMDLQSETRMAPIKSDRKPITTRSIRSIKFKSSGG